VTDQILEADGAAPGAAARAATLAVRVSALHTGSAAGATWASRDNSARPLSRRALHPQHVAPVISWHSDPLDASSRPASRALPVRPRLVEGRGFDLVEV
jgi:hypothetical protein